VNMGCCHATTYLSCNPQWVADKNPGGGAGEQVKDSDAVQLRHLYVNDKDDRREL
jgi:hypothetical protein